VHRLQVDLDAERLHRLRQHRLAQELVGRRDEIVPLDPMHLRLLREHWCLMRCENSRETGTGCLQEFATSKAGHRVFLLQEGYGLTLAEFRTKYVIISSPNLVSQCARQPERDRRDV